MTAPATPPRRMTLASVTNEAIPEPDRIFIYGTEKVGKSTFGACAPAPIFISAERGLGELKPTPAHFPEAESFKDVLDAIEELTTGKHEFRTLVIDSLDWVEQMITAAVCARCKTKSGRTWTMEDFTAYGAGQKIAVEDWRKMLLAIDRMQDKTGMEAILIAHATTKNFDDPTGQPFTRYEPQMTGNVGPKLVKQWAKSILFARHEYMIEEAEGFGKSKGKSTGRRVIYTEWNAAYDAGSRYDLPPVMDLDYAKYAEARDNGKVLSPATLEAKARALLERWAPEGDEKATATAYIAASSGDVVKLSKLVERLRAKVAEKESA